jgi:cysteinyl-tRNA synthetase
MSDLLKRSLVFLGYGVNHLMNITDVEDKIIRKMNSENVSLRELTGKYERIFFHDLVELNVIKPNRILRATGSIKDMENMIRALLKKGYAYRTSDGVYFSISKSKGYGNLAGLGKMDKAMSRVASDEYDKSNPRDFALWKFRVPGDREAFWDAEFGKGRPGWHIECSAMSMKVLGKHFDIHTGGMDLIFPHHTNEIAQSEAYSGKKFVNYWIHGALLNMKDGKMSKSLKNIWTLNDLKEKGFSPIDFRYMCLGTHYRKPLEFSVENLQVAKNSLQRMRNIISGIGNDRKTSGKYLDEFERAIKDDLNMPLALQVLWNLLRDENEKGKLGTIRKFDKVLGLGLLEKKRVSFPREVKILAEQREMFRKKKDFKKSDEARKMINDFGFDIEDTEKGYVLKKR